MKTFLLVLALASTPALARDFNVRGEAARSLMSALQEAGANAHHFLGTSSYSVSGVRCGSAAGRGSVRFSCEFKDEHTGRVVRARENAKELFRELQKYVEPTAHPGGRVIDVASVSCGSSPTRGKPPRCSVEP